MPAAIFNERFPRHVMITIFSSWANTDQQRNRASQLARKFSNFFFFVGNICCDLLALKNEQSCRACEFRRRLCSSSPSWYSKNVCMTPKSWVKFMLLSVYNSLKGVCVKINLTLEEASIYNFIITY